MSRTEGLPRCNRKCDAAPQSYNVKEQEEKESSFNYYFYKDRVLVPVLMGLLITPFLEKLHKS
jgi:hypothetical protein